MSELSVRVLSRRLRRPFVISTGPRTVQTAVEVRIRADGVEGVGEASGVSYLGETAEGMAARIETVRGAIEAGVSRADLLELLPPGGARFALDSALWDFEARATGRAVAEKIGVKDARAPQLTAFTISLDTPEAMEAAAREASGLGLLKVKLGGKDGLDGERARAVRRGAPEATLIADANAGWTAENLARDAEALAEAGFALLEQPLPAGADDALIGFDSPLPLCGDESVQSLADLDRAAERYEFINIKLDKCGGLTHALEMRERLRRLGCSLFVGCMICGVRAIAPAFLFARKADFVDLDGPLWLAEDETEITMDPRGMLSAPPQGFWGEP
ncbi:MAG: dipeptide epimerase [Oceanicaulis sp.]